MTTIDNLSQLPPELLNQVALSLPVSDLATFCRTSSGLAQICNDESFWRRRLEQDMLIVSQSIQAVRLTDFSYKELYQGFSTFLSSVPYLDGPNRIEYLVYPAPQISVTSFREEEVDENIYTVQPDIIIMQSGSQLLLAQRNRETVLGTNPLIGQRMPVRRATRAAMEDFTGTVPSDVVKKFDSYQIITINYFRELMNEARGLGYLSLDLYPTWKGELHYGTFIESYQELFQRVDKAGRKRDWYARTNIEAEFGQKPYQRAPDVPPASRPVRRSPKKVSFK